MEANVNCFLVLNPSSREYSKKAEYVLQPTWEAGRYSPYAGATDSLWRPEKGPSEYYSLSFLQQRTSGKK